eukprot:gene3060-5837_t
MRLYAPLRATTRASPPTGRSACQNLERLGLVFKDVWRSPWKTQKRSSESVAKKTQVVQLLFGNKRWMLRGHHPLQPKDNEEEEEEQEEEQEEQEEEQASHSNAIQL